MSYLLGSGSFFLRYMLYKIFVYHWPKAGPAFKTLGQLCSTSGPWSLMRIPFPMTDRLYVTSSCVDACAFTNLFQVAFPGKIALVVHGPDRVTVHPPPQDSLRPRFFCFLDLPRYQKSMPLKKSWDGLPVLGHFQNGRRQNLVITFCAIT